MGEDWDRTQEREPLGDAPLATIPRSLSSWVGGGSAIGACSEGRTVCGYPEASACAGCPVLPPPGVSQTESRSCQTLRRGEARQNQLCYFGTWLILLPYSPPLHPPTHLPSLRAPTHSWLPALCLPHGVIVRIGLDFPWNKCGGGCSRPLPFMAKRTGFWGTNLLGVLGV